MDTWSRCKVSWDEARDRFLGMIFAKVFGITVISFQCYQICYWKYETKNVGNWEITKVIKWEQDQMHIFGRWFHHEVAGFFLHFFCTLRSGLLTFFPPLQFLKDLTSTTLLTSQTKTISFGAFILAHIFCSRNYLSSGLSTPWALHYSEIIFYSNTNLQLEGNVISI